MALQDDDKIPAGSEVPAASGETPTQEQDQSTDQPQDNQQEESGSETPKDEGSEALQKQIANLEKLIGRQGKELGELRQFKSESEKKSETPAEEEPDYNAQLADIEEKLDNGELGVTQALRMVAEISANMGATTATKSFETKLQQSESQKVMQQFMDSNPDFAELRESGELDDIMQKNPLHDEFSAYHEYKRNEAIADMEAKIQAARAEGEQKGANMASQASKASNVLGKQGSDVRDKNKPTSYNSPAERRQAMVDALKGARSAQ